VVEGGGAGLAVGGDTAGRHLVDDKRGWWDGVRMAPEDDGRGGGGTGMEPEDGVVKEDRQRRARPEEDGAVSRSP
jgi:hypothetical protein